MPGSAYLNDFCALCRASLNHNEQENVQPADLKTGCNVLLHAMLKNRRALKNEPRY
jgi:hypothetical protein